MRCLRRPCQGASLVGVGLFWIFAASRCKAISASIGSSSALSSSIHLTRLHRPGLEKRGSPALGGASGTPLVATLVAPVVDAARHRRRALGKELDHQVLRLFLPTTACHALDRHACCLVVMRCSRTCSGLAAEIHACSPSSRGSRQAAPPSRTAAVRFEGAVLSLRGVRRPPGSVLG